MSPATIDHERVIVRLASRLNGFVEANRLGEVYGSNALYMTRGEDRGRSPDVSFICNARLPAKCVTGSRLKVETIPDLVVEVVSPSESKRSLAAKTAEYLVAGVRAVWIVRLDQTATLYNPGVEPTDVPRQGALVDEDLLPGFSVRLADLFER